ncbi:hypothetical protein ACUSIJ_04680 [Pseudochelatococcus sp. B33]
MHADDQCASNNLRFARLKSALHGGISIAALSVAFVVGAGTDAGSQAVGGDAAPRYIVDNKGKNGADARNANEPATTAENAASIDVTIKERISGDGTLIGLSSTGGSGGKAYGTAYPQEEAPSSAGARGGNINFVFDGELAPKSDDHTTATPLILLLSKGGAGGGGTFYSRSYGMNSVTFTVPGSAGGAGGDILARIQKSLHTSGERFAAIRATTQGGNAGDYVLGRATQVGGAAGSVNLAVTSAATISTDGFFAPAVILEALGGAGGNASIGAGLAGSTGGATGRGADGSEKDAVVFSNAGTIHTSGGSAPAVVLQSIGGTGGAGGYYDQTTGIGTGGGGGGQAGNIRFDNLGTIKTEEASSFAVVAQSIGGSGGKGGSAATFGGKGGSAGQAGDVDIVNRGTITTDGDNATAIVAQSVGGGNALDAFRSYETTFDKTHGTGTGGGSGGSATFGAFFGGGGDGGTGGDGGAVNVANTGTIETQRSGAFGVLAQSIGGSGGSAGNASSNALLFSIALGGAGGGGGHGGPVSVSTVALRTADGTPVTKEVGSITTWGYKSDAIVAQSIGGGGGVGGSATARSAGAVLSVGVAIGGSGGAGGDGRLVSVENTSALTTHGDESTGVFAQSVGGGGGHAGDANTYTFSVSTTFPAISVPVTIGGSGGGGGHGGYVEIDNWASIKTYGRKSAGIEGQSVGGGGGKGGNAVGYAYAVNAGVVGALDVPVTIGGTGGDGGNGGKVSLANAGSILTTGDLSPGMLARSIGGGGGDAGSATSNSSMLSAYPQIALSVTIGGTGGKGGHGDDTSAINAGSINTSGEASHGIKAMSLGGGGGDGNSASSDAAAGVSLGWMEKGHVRDGLETVIKTISSTILPIGDSFSARLQIGGSGGDGGNGGTVTVGNSGSISTAGVNASGIFAQSVGGGGGDGGGYNGGGDGGGGDTTAALNMNVGGKGGKGGHGSDVTVSNTAAGEEIGKIATTASGSHGIFAQSVGGGGGVGGSFTGDRAQGISLSKLNSLDDWLSAAVKLGGELQRVNKAGQATLGTDKPKDWEDPNNPGKWRDPDEQKLYESNYFNTGNPLQDKADYLKKIMPSAKALANKKQDLAERVLKSAGYAALEVFKHKHAAQIKSTKDAVKQWATGGTKPPELPNVAINATFGGTGGGGGNGGAVAVDNAGMISTRGQIAYGILAQSIGGGGGAGGAAYVNGNNYMNLNVTLGGKGGEGGHGGTVTVGNSGSIATSGAASYGILAQSIGGGGGVGGGATSSNTISASFNTDVGGSGGKSSHGGAVTVNNTGTITTEGQDSHAVLAQSVGGGGGVSFLNYYNEDAAFGFETLDLPAKVLESVQEAVLLTNDFLRAIGITPESGDAGVDNDTTILPKPALNLSVGGNGGGGGNGGKVAVNHSGTITTKGAGAFGIVAQSVGGGGGVGGNATKGGLVLQGNVSIGGKGGVGGNGGEVTVAFGENGPTHIETSGTSAHAVFAQSIGGGGGLGGFAEYNILGKFVRDDSASGNGGAITITTSGDYRDSATRQPRIVISTTGDGAHGIFAQSLGGGGGTVASLKGTAIPVTLSPEASARKSSGDGGKVTIDTRADIHATGKDAFGIFVQSGRQATDGSLSMPATTFWPWSDPNYDGKQISINHNGNITGGSGEGAAIRVDGGSSDNIIKLWWDSTVQALSGTAIIGTWGNETIENHGTLIGNLKLHAGHEKEFNAVRNTGTYRTSENGVINLGHHEKSVFVNEGHFDIGGVGRATTATLTGHLEMDRGSALLVDVGAASRASGAPTNDRLDVTGKVIFWRGANIHAHVGGFLDPGGYHVLSATDGIEGTAPTVSGTSSGVVPINWSVHGPWTQQVANVIGDAPPRQLGDRNNLYIAASARFTQPVGVTLSNNQRSVAERVERYWENSVEPGALFNTLLSLPTGAQYAQALDEVSPDANAEAAVPHYQHIRVGLGMPLSCPAFGASGTLMQESDCVWGRVQAEHARMSESFGTSHYTRNVLAYRVGAQREVAPGWFVGLAGAYITAEHNDRDGITRSDTDGFEGALAVKREIGPWQFAASAMIGKSSHEGVRHISIGKYGIGARSESETVYGGARLRGSYTFAFDNWYVRPYVDVDVLHQRSPSFSEYGAPGFNLHVLSNSSTVYSFTPNLEIGGRFDISDGVWLRPYGTVGFALLSHDKHTLRANLLDDLGRVDTFETSAYMPDKLVDFGIGVQIFSDKGVDFTTEYKATKGRHYLSHTGSAKLSVRF